MNPEVIFILVALSVTVSGTDYCSLSCRNERNILCNAQGTFGPRCQQASIFPMTNAIRHQFLNGHNLRRSFTAQGRLGGFFQPAARMATILWDYELERGALENVLQCEMEHDHCRRTTHYVYAGQNLATHCMIPTYGNAHMVIENAMKNWFNEYTDLPPSYLHSYGSGPRPRDQVGHFTQMVRDKAFAMGCAIVRSMNGRWACYYIACNYATTNMLGSPVYEVGPMGSKCRSGMNPNYPGLCSQRENYYDDTMLFQ